jgi:GTP-binding protein YchF
MKIGLVGFPGCGKSTVFGALTGRRVETGYASRSSSAHLAVVKVPDPRVDALAELYSPKKITYAEIEFRDLPSGHDAELDRTSLNAMREVDALCQVLRGFESEAGDAPDALREIIDLEAETLLADLQVAEARVERLRKDRSNPRELALLERIQEALEAETPLRSMELGEEEQRLVAGYAFLTRKPLLLVLNVPEDDAALEIAEPIRVAAKERGLGLVSLSGPVEMDIAELPVAEQPEFLESLGLKEPASGRFVRAAFALIDLISMLTAGPDECRAWPIRRGTFAPKAAGRIHSDIERGFIRVEVTAFEDLIELGSEARCRDAGKLRVEGKEYEVCDGDVVHFRFNV